MSHRRTPRVDGLTSIESWVFLDDNVLLLWDSQDFLPLFTPNLLHLFTTQMYGSSGRVERETVLDHQLDVLVDPRDLGVLIGRDLVGNGRQIHRPLDHVVIIRDPQGNRVYKSDQASHNAGSARGHVCSARNARNDSPTGT